MSSIQNVNTIAELRALTEGSSDNVLVAGYHANGDGGGGLFTWDASVGGADDQGIIIKPTVSTGNGRWKRIFSGEINVLWFGAKGDGGDDHAAMDYADAYINGLSGGATLFFPATQNGYGYTTAQSFEAGTDIRMEHILLQVL